jgi:hypothetical protein
MHGRYECDQTAFEHVIRGERIKGGMVLVRGSKYKQQGTGACFREEVFLVLYTLAGGVFNEAMIS